MIKWAALAVLLVGCGEEIGSSPVVGSWAYYYTATQAHLATFEENGTYRLDNVLVVSGGADASEVAGTYSVDGDQLTLTPTETSCEAASPMTVRYVADASGLTFDYGAGLMTYVPGPVPALTLGCSDQRGNFVPSPLRPN